MWAIEKTQTLFILLALNMLVLLPRGPSHSGERPSVPCTIFNQSRHPQCCYFRASSNEPQERQNIQSARRRMTITKENNNKHESYQRERERDTQTKHWRTLGKRKKQLNRKRKQNAQRAIPDNWKKNNNNNKPQRQYHNMISFIGK